MFGLFVQKHAEAVNIFADVASLYVHPDNTISRQEIHTTFDNGFLEVIVYFPTVKSTFSNGILKQFNYLKAYNAGLKVIQKTWGMPDIIQANVFTRTALIADIIKVIYGIPYTVIEHWTRYFREITFRNKFHKLVSVYAAKRASAIMPVTQHLQKCMELHGMRNNNYQIINNVVDDIFFEKLAEPTSGKVRILNVTCFDDPQKNLSGLLHVIKRLYQKRQDFEIYLVGKGIDSEKIKMLASEMKLENEVVFITGMLTGKTLVEAYQKSHFSVLFSNYENIPVVISESFACGLPVVSTSVGGIDEHIDSSNGILINANDENALFESLDYMIDHFADYDKEAIMNYAKEKYSYQSVGKHLFNIYSTIIKK
jgi:glycosyltransferase involved in cell wall biosynthesis